MDILLEPWRKPIAEEATAAAIKGVTTAASISVNSERIVAYREGLQEGRRMSLMGKMKALTESAEQFNSETESVLDEIAEKITSAKVKRTAAAAKHHTYYDGLTKAIEDSVVVIDRLSNGPLSGDGEK